MSPLWTSLDMPSLTCSCNTFTSSHLPLLLLSQTFSAQPHHVHVGNPSSAGCGIHRNPAEGKADEMRCSQRFMVTHSPVLRWVVLCNTLLTIYSCIPFPLRNTPLVCPILVYPYAPFSNVRTLSNSQDLTLGIPNIWTLGRWSVHAVTRMTKA